LRGPTPPPASENFGGAPGPIVQRSDESATTQTNNAVRQLDSCSDWRVKD